MNTVQHLDGYYRVKHYSEPGEWAVTDTDKPGRCVITWEHDGQLTDVQCDGWITTDGRLWAPTDGQAAPGTYFREGVPYPDPDGLWYSVRLGREVLRDQPDKDRYDAQLARAQAAR